MCYKYIWYLVFCICPGDNVYCAYKRELHGSHEPLEGVQRQRRRDRRKYQIPNTKYTCNAGQTRTKLLEQVPNTKYQIYEQRTPENQAQMSVT